MKSRLSVLLALFLLFLLSAMAFARGPVEHPRPKPVPQGLEVYRATVQAVTEQDIVFLEDPAFGRKWQAEWVHKYDHDPRMKDLAYADQRVREMMASLKQPYNWYFVPPHKNKVEAGKAGAGKAEADEAVVHYRSDLGENIGFIVMDNVESPHCLDEMRAALAQSRARKDKILILDLRFNRGGWGRYAIKTCQMLVPDGVILTQTYRNGRHIKGLRFTACSAAPGAAEQGYVLREEWTVGKPSSYHVSRAEREPLMVDPETVIVVLVNDYTASAAEIIAGCLQRNHVAILVGEPTRGKGVGQKEISLPYGRYINVTNFHFQPGGVDSNGVGLVPDIEVNTPAGDENNRARLGNQLQTAIDQGQSLLEARAKLAKERQKLKLENEEVQRWRLEKQSKPEN